MSKLIKDLGALTNLYVDVPNDKFEELYSAFDGGWAGSNNQFCTTFDSIEEMVDDADADEIGREFAKEFMQTWKDKKLPRGCDVTIQKEDPK